MARLVCARTVSSAFASRSTGLAISIFLCISTVRFALGLNAGNALPVEAVWAASAVPVLPFLSCVLTMRLWARERESAAMELALVAPVPASALARGKFLGAWTVSLVSLALYALVPLVFLPFFRDGPQSAPPSCLPAFCGLAMQAAVWCAAGTFASAVCRHAASAGAATLLATVCLPYAAYRAAIAWIPAARARMAGLPPVEYAVDAATGMFSFAVAGGCLAFTLAAIEAAGQSVEALRCAGAGTRGTRIARYTASLLAFVLAALATAVLERTGMVWDLAEHAKSGPSARLRHACEHAGGPLRATCFIARGDPLAGAAARLMRSFELAARSCGVEASVSYIDPNWDEGDAAAFAADGISAGTVVFEFAGRRAAVPAAELFPEGSRSDRDGMLRAECICASAISSMRPGLGRNAVYALTGHGESSFFDKGDWGLSKLSRWLRFDGFEVKPLDLSAVPAVPADCCVLAVAGARERFSDDETSKIDSYMRGGGRMFAMVRPHPGAGAAPYLRRWGCKVTPYVAVVQHPAPSKDVKAALEPSHPATAHLPGGSVLFDSAAVLEREPPSPGASAGATFAPLVLSPGDGWGESNISDRPWMRDSSEPSGPLVLAAAIESGSSASPDVGVTPARIVAVGDFSAALNSSIENRGNANLDFILNSFRWLAGVETAPSGYSVSANGRVFAGRSLAGFLAAAAFAFPLVVLVAAAVRARSRGRGGKK